MNSPAARLTASTGRERPVGPHLDDQLVPLGLLADAGLLDEEVRLAHRGEDGVDRDDPDRLAFLLVALGGDIALAALDHQVHAQLRLGRVQGGDVLAGVADLDVAGGLDIAGGDVPGAVHVEADAHRVGAVREDVDLLDVEQDLGDVFLDVLDRAELVGDALDRDRGDRGAGERRQEHAAKRVAERDPESGLERLDLELAVIGAALDLFDRGGGHHVNCHSGLLYREQGRCADPGAEHGHLE